MNYSLSELRNIPVLFIVGKGRSGTTLLSTILDSHPNVASATESRFLLLIWQKYKYMKEWKPNLAEDFVENVLKDLRVKYLWDFEDQLVENLKALPAEASIQDLIKLVYIYRKSNFPKERIRFIIDKNPKYTIFVDRLKYIFPEAKFFRLIRDPRDNITSQVKFSKKTVGMLAYKWNKYNQKLDRFDRQYPGDFLSLRFEDLVLDKQSFFQSFEQFTGIDSLAELEEKRLNYKDQFEEKFSDRLKEQHQSSVKPLNPKKIGHHKEKLSEAQIRTIDAFCFPYASNFGYERELSPRKLGIGEKLAATINYHILTSTNVFFYSLPFPVILKISQFLINYVHFRKKEKLEEIKEANAN